MRLTTPAGRTLRAALAVGICGAVLAGSLTVVLVIAIVGGMIGTAYASDLLGFAHIDPPRYVWPGTWSVCALVALGWITRAIARTVRAEREALLERTVPPSEVAVAETSHLDSSLERLARQGSIPVPELRVDPTATPLAYTTYRPDDPIVRVGRDETPVVVISRGLIELLPRSELVAVLAHEIGHLANDDRRLITVVLVPLIAAETLTEDVGTTTNVAEICGHLLSFVASIGVGVFARGRELAADRAAVTMTGDPGALAAALERLSSVEPPKPTADLRQHARSTNAINAVPTLTPGRDTAGLHSMHPPLETRLEQLRTFAADES